jgi:hypothetical protein
VHNHTLRDRKIQDVNPKIVGIRPYTQFSRVDQSQSTSKLTYSGLYARLARKPTERTEWNLSYTYVRSSDNNPLSRFLDPFHPEEDWGPSNGERRHALVGSGEWLFPWAVRIGFIGSFRSQLPWTPTAGRDLNGDGFNTDLVPGTTRNSGGRDLNLTAINAWRISNGLAPILATQVDSSRLRNIDLSLSKSVQIRRDISLTLTVQAFNVLNTTSLQDQFSSGRVTNSLSSQFGKILTSRSARQLELCGTLRW